MKNPISADMIVIRTLPPVCPDSTALAGMIAVHTLPPICPGFTAFHEAEIVSAAEAPQEGSDDTGRTVVVGTTPLSGTELASVRRLFEEAIMRMKDEASSEGGDGFLLGYDPLTPDARIPAGELGIAEEIVFVWNRPAGNPSLLEWNAVVHPIFEWNAVVHVTITEATVEVFLADGSAVFLHADIDWWNRLS